MEIYGPHHHGVAPTTRLTSCVALLNTLITLFAGGSTFGSSFSSEDADPYAWAQRLREIPDKDALQELGLMGYLGADGSSSSSGSASNGSGRSGVKFSFTKGTGSGGQRGSKRAGTGRNGAARAKGRSS